LAVHILNASGSIIPHKTLVPLHYDVTCPPIAADGSEVVLRVKLDEEITKARLYVPENKNELMLDVKKRDGTVMVIIKPDQLISYGVVLMQND
jgi:hypothetical protein